VNLPFFANDGDGRSMNNLRLSRVPIKLVLTLHLGSQAKKE
jgi:hypothetical protein